MTETSVIYQAGFTSLGIDDQVAGDIPERCRVMLLHDPRARRDYRYAHITYLRLYHDLDAMRMRPWAEFELWYCSRAVPDYRTIANRCQELMRADASLKPPREVEQHRQRQRTQGRVK